MAYIRNRTELLTGCQESKEWSPEIDLQYDFVIVYGIDDQMPERIQKFREKGYIVHVMTGCAWGEYQDYLNGKWDGRAHWDESQTDREGNPILHGIEVPYLVPSVSFSNYLSKRLEAAIDAGAEAIHLEEPEFWDNGGYSEAFKQEYRLFYGEEWVAPHTSLEARYRSSRLKVWLYRRLISRVSESVKEYGMKQYGKRIAFYVPTHSLINYTQWKILSPEATLLDIPTVDGYIAQIWTGTSRTANVYAGKYEERTFETAFLEYGVMQELVRTTGRKMWFLHDPVEDFPEYTWEDFRSNYLKTVAASLMHPEVYTYEVCPWPTRVFHGIYPKKMELKSGMAPGEEMEGAKRIPQSYASLLSAITQLLGDMEQKENKFVGTFPKTGIFISDSALYQRTFPDEFSSSKEGVEELNSKLLSLLLKSEEQEIQAEKSRTLMREIGCNKARFYDYIASAAFPQFFGLAMPLIKCGVPARPVQLENIKKDPDYLNMYQLLILSYEYMKPNSPDFHFALSEWVQNGGALLYVGDGSDPYHGVPSWWNTGKKKDKTPAEHLFRSMGLPYSPCDGIYPYGKGYIAVYSVSPASITLSEKAAQQYRDRVHQLAATAGYPFADQNFFCMHRGPYRIVNVMKESVSEAPLSLKGLYCDLLTTDFSIVTEKTLFPGENSILFDFSEIEKEKSKIIGTSARIFSFSCTEREASLTAKAAGGITAKIRIRLPFPVQNVKATDDKDQNVDVCCKWDTQSRSALLSYKSKNQIVKIRILS